MDKQFWHERWEKNEIAFHGSEANPLLVEHFDKLSLAEGARVFIPLCGKTLDIAWLLSKGYRVVGAELSRVAVGQLFENLGVEPTISKKGNLDQYSANGIDIFVGDIFELSGEMLGEVDAIYDRAALVALPEEMRLRYQSHLLEITNAVPQLLVTYQYDQRLMNGPPFSVSDDEVKQHYADHYKLSLLQSIDLPDGLKGKCAAVESVWLLADQGKVN